MKPTEKKRIVQAPYSGSSDLPGQVLSVELGEEEEVIWQWTHRPDGKSAVTGYEKVKKTEEKIQKQYPMNNHKIEESEIDFANTKLDEYRRKIYQLASGLRRDLWKH